MNSTEERPLTNTEQRQLKLQLAYTVIERVLSQPPPPGYGLAPALLVEMLTAEGKAVFAEALEAWEQQQAAMEEFRAAVRSP